MVNKNITYKEAEEYFWEQMKNGKIESDYQQIVFEKAIEALRFAIIEEMPDVDKDW